MAVAKRQDPRYAPGQELTLHPGDPVKGAELLEDKAGEANVAQQEKPTEKRRN
jgi:hypothetical protein